MKMLSKVNVNVQPHFVILRRVASTSGCLSLCLTQNCALNFGQLQDASLHEVCAREAVKGLFLGNTRPTHFGAGELACPIDAHLQQSTEETRSESG